MSSREKQIKALRKLRDQGVITQIEFQTKEAILKTDGSKKSDNRKFIIITMILAIITIVAASIYFYVYHQQLERYNDLIDLMEYQNEELDKNIKLFNGIEIVDKMTWREFFSHERHDNINAEYVLAAEKYLYKIDEYVELQIILISDSKNIKLLNRFDDRQKDEKEMISHLTNVYKHLEDRVDTYNYLVDHANSNFTDDTDLKRATIVLSSHIPHSDPYYAFGLKK